MSAEQGWFRNSSMARSFGKRAGHNGTGKDRLPSLLAVGTLDFARSSFIGAGMGVQGDGVFLVAAGAGEVDQNVESRRFCFRLCGLPWRLQFLTCSLSGVDVLIGACQHLLRPFAHFVLLPSDGEGDRNL